MVVSPKAFIAAASVTLPLLAGCVSHQGGGGIAPIGARTSTVTVTYIPSPPPGQPKTTFDGNGTYQVGVDVAPGVYRSAGTVPGGQTCYWARLKSLSTSDIINNNLGEGPQVVELKPTDKAFLTEHCQPWQKSD